MARVAAVRKFKAVGWHQDAGRDVQSSRGKEDIERSGAGRWYCPECGRKGHL
jgi:hypothetical protein